MELGQRGTIASHPHDIIGAGTSRAMIAVGSRQRLHSYRRRAALERKQKGVGRPQKHATIKDLDPLSLRDNQTPT
jgi:hypothetical protein